MYLNHNKKFLFIAVPKTGSISISFSLGQTDIPEPDLYHQSIHSAIQKHPECANYFKFGFVRNPWARILSLYNDFTLKRKYQYSALVKHDKPLFGEFANFEDFCLRVHTTNWINDIFLKSQSELLGVTTDSSLIDYVGRFENLQTDFDRICYMIQCPELRLQSMNIGEYDNKRYKEHYTPAAIDAVARLYATDIKVFKYDF